MHNNVVVAVVLYFQRLGLTTVRFNFAGSQIGRGLVQAEQIKTVATSLLNGQLLCVDSDTETGDEMTSVQKDDPTSTMTAPKYLILVGYSYGSLIALSASASIPQCIASISIAPPFGVMHWLLAFHSDHHLRQASANEALARLFLIGDRDNFTSEAKFKLIIDEHFPSTATTTGAVIKDADHFFARREKDIMDVIGEWLLRTFPQCQGDMSKLWDLGFGVSM
jgi:alpha/beta superfamily hydrolase